MKKLFMNDYPLLLMPKLATKVGLLESIFLVQLHYWLTKSKHRYEGKVWVYNTLEDWHEQFPFVSVMTIRRLVKKLEKDQLIFTAHFNRSKMDRTKWYTINYDAIEALMDDVNNSSEQMEQIDGDERTEEAFNLHTPIPETTTEKEEEEEECARKKNSHTPKENPYTFFEQNGFGTIGGYIAEKINYWCEDLSEELVVEAMKLAVEYGAKRWSYVESILRYWYDKGYETVSDIRAARKAYQERMADSDRKKKRTSPPVPHVTEYDMNAGEEDDD